MQPAANYIASDDRSQRRHLRIPGTIRDALGSPLDVLVQNLSTSGFCADLDAALPIGARIRLGTTALRLTDAHVVWTDGQRHGFAFDTEISQNDVVSATHAPNVIKAAFDPRGNDAWGAPSLDIEPHTDKYPRMVRAAILIIPAALFWGFVILRIY